MLLKCELMLLKCQINTNTNKIGFLHPTKYLELELAHIWIALAHTWIALAHLNSTEKMHQLCMERLGMYGREAVKKRFITTKLLPSKKHILPYPSVVVWFACFVLRCELEFPQSEKKKHCDFSSTLFADYINILLYIYSNILYSLFISNIVPKISIDIF